MRDKLSVIIGLLLFSAGLTAQEVITGLAADSRMQEAYLTSDRRKAKAADSLDLPFFEDFARISIYPDAKKWTDQQVLVNDNYPIAPVSIGVATLDALDEQGRLYENASSFPFAADQLTSHPFRLPYSPADSLYLSFFVQGGGLGDAPENDDELVLEFYDPGSETWQEIWHTAGTDDTTFRQVMIPVKEAEYFGRGFQFRFRNMASLSANTSDPAQLTNSDLWHIDYIRFDKDRSYTDTLVSDVAFVYPLETTLVDYEAMPWDQFRETYLFQMKPFLNIQYQNNDLITRNVTRNFSIYSEYDAEITHSFSAGAVNIPPSTFTSYDAGLIYTYNSEEADSALFRLTAWLITDEFDPRGNDTLQYDQVFGNYFAYDDGTAESGYGINGQGSRNALVAYRFETFTGDSLTALQIRFNHSFQNANQQYFDLVVWSEADDKPGDIIYEQADLLAENLSPQNAFRTYYLDTAQWIDGPFYIGWRQKSETFLNVGLDLNRQHTDKLWYYLNGSWFRSQAKGSLMMRPVFGESRLSTGIPQQQEYHFLLYPNPVQQQLHIRKDPAVMEGSLWIRIFDMQGRLIREQPYRESMDVSDFPAGMYILQVDQGRKVIARERFLRLR